MLKSHGVPIMRVSGSNPIKTCETARHFAVRLVRDLAFAEVQAAPVKQQRYRYRHHYSEFQRPCGPKVVWRYRCTLCMGASVGGGHGRSAEADPSAGLLARPCARSVGRLLLLWARDRSELGRRGR